MSDIETMAIVTQVGEMSFEGNIIPQSWFTHLKYPSGKPYLTAIMILSEIVYWYRPREGRDGRREKKFKEDCLQRTYDSFAEQFGFNKRETVDAVKYLAQQGIIRTELRTVTLDNGRCLRNVLFIHLAPQRLRDITYGRQQARAHLAATSVQTEVTRLLTPRASAQTEVFIPTSVSPEVNIPAAAYSSVEMEAQRISSSVETEAAPVSTPAASAQTEARGATASVQTETLRLAGRSTHVRMEAEPPRGRNTYTDNNKLESIATENQEHSLAMTGQNGAHPPLDPTGAVPPAGLTFPLTARLDEWCRQKFGKPIFPTNMRDEQCSTFEEALLKLDVCARSCGQSAFEVLTTRLMLREEVQRQVRHAAWPYTVISRQMAFALEDYAERASRRTPVAASVAAEEPVARRRANVKPAWMSEEEWAFHQQAEGHATAQKGVACAAR